MKFPIAGFKLHEFGLNHVERHSTLYKQRSITLYFNSNFVWKAIGSEPMAEQAPFINDEQLKRQAENPSQTHDF